MRQTVDEKLHATLETRLTESFRQVSDRLERVHQGLGEMQQLAIGVGDLKRVLTNVKTRGTWGEVQLEMLLEQVLTVDQYAKNVETVPARTRASSSRSSCRAWSTAARRCGCRSTPSSRRSSTSAWSKRRARRCRRRGALWRRTGTRGAQRGQNDLRKVRLAAADHRFRDPVPADRRPVCRSDAPSRPGRRPAAHAARDDRRPVDLSALLNSLQMGFRTLALEKRSSEVWQVLGAVKTEFGKFGDVLARPS
jgi:DNA recombination protein RmuC